MQYREVNKEQLCCKKCVYGIDITGLRGSFAKLNGISFEEVFVRNWNI